MPDSPPPPPPSDAAPAAPPPDGAPMPPPGGVPMPPPGGVGAPSSPTRRGFLRGALRGAALLSAGAVLGGLAGRRRVGAGEAWTWQIDPERCQGRPGGPGCELCAGVCVLSPSAVKCFHRMDMCGYCERCFGYFRPDAVDADEGAENQMCPTGAIRRRLVEAPYYEYTVDKERCIGCGRCVKGCQTSGNASLFLQIDQGRCRRCNDCALRRACPHGAVVRVPAEPAGGAYLPRRRHGEAPPDP